MTLQVTHNLSTWDLAKARERRTATVSVRCHFEEPLPLLHPHLS